MTKKWNFENLFATLFLFLLLYFLGTIAVSLLFSWMNDSLKIFNELFVILVSIFTSTLCFGIALHVLYLKYKLKQALVQAFSFKFCIFAISILGLCMFTFIGLRVTRVFYENTNSYNVGESMEQNFDEIKDSLKGEIDSIQLRKIIKHLKDTNSVHWVWTDHVAPDFSISYPDTGKSKRELELFVNSHLYFLTEQFCTPTKLQDENLKYCYAVLQTEDDFSEDPDQFKVKLLESYRKFNHGVEPLIFHNQDENPPYIQSVFKLRNNHRVVSRIIQNEETFYILSVYTTSKNISNHSIKRFFNSLEF